MYNRTFEHMNHCGHEMKITKAQAQANRERVVETASKLFRERGYDGVGVADLMAESAACGIAQTVALSAGADAPEFVRYYLSREHRDARATGCTMAALGGDAARQSDAVRAEFAAGIENLLTVLCPEGGAGDGADTSQARARSLDMLAHAVGAIVMSRACPDDSPLADEILAACRDQILASMSPSTTAVGEEP